MMVAIQHLTHNASHNLPPEEKMFLDSTFRHLSHISGKKLKIESWEISSYEVEFEELISEGGFGEVFRGVWNGSVVALKVLKDDGIAPRAASIKNEVKVCFLHPHKDVSSN